MLRSIPFRPNMNLSLSVSIFTHRDGRVLAIDASSCMELMHKRTDFSYTAQFDTTLRNNGYCKSWNAQIGKSLRKICHYQQNVPQHYYI